MIRLARQGQVVNNREQLRIDFNRAAPLRELYPQLAELRIEFDFEDSTRRAPSAIAYSFFPAARGFFRFACPCHTCSGEFDLSAAVTELAGEEGRPRRNSNMQFACQGLRLQELNVREPCPIIARIRLSATLHTTEQAS